jgi:hypothetical protein
MRSSSWKFWLIQGTIAALLIGGVGYSLMSTPTPTRVETPVTVAGVTTQGVRPEMSALRIILISKNTEEPVSLELDMNVRQRVDGFEYYHYGEMTVGARAYSDYSAGPINTLALAPGGFLEEITVNRAPDLSTRYNVSLHGIIKGQRFSADIQKLSGDFLQKNTELYYKEVSIGTAVMTLNGTTFDAHAVVIPMYSRDYTKYIYFKEYNDVRGMARQFIVFDSEGGAYIVDRSDVTNPVPAYTSHQWVFAKRPDGASYKGFAATVDVTASNRNGESSWVVRSTDVPFTFNAETVTKYAGALDGRTIRGTVETPDGRSLPIIGIAHIEIL